MVGQFFLTPKITPSNPKWSSHAPTCYEGDLIITFDIVYPKALSEDQKVRRSWAEFFGRMGNLKRWEFTMRDLGVIDEWWCWLNVCDSGYPIIIINIIININIIIIINNNRQRATGVVIIIIIIIMINAIIIFITISMDCISWDVLQVLSNDRYFK